MERVTVSLPSDLVGRVRDLSKKSGLKVSRIVAIALEEHLATRSAASGDIKAPVRPTVLWKLRGRSRARGPSPTLRRGKLGRWRSIGLDNLQI